KYRLSAFGTSRSCPRVMSPTPGRSTLITSAPIQASSCVQVGPDCTCVKSRIRTPSSALLIPLPHPIEHPEYANPDPRPASCFLLGRRIQAGDAAALGAPALVDDRVDQRR